MPVHLTPIEEQILRRAYDGYLASAVTPDILVQSPPRKSLEWEQAVIALVNKGYVVVVLHVPWTPGYDKLYVRLRITEAGRNAWRRVTKT